MHDIFFLAVGVILTGIGLLMITAKVLTYIRFIRQNAGKKKGAIHYEKTDIKLIRNPCNGYRIIRVDDYKSSIERNLNRLQRRHR